MTYIEKPSYEELINDFALYIRWGYNKNPSFKWYDDFRLLAEISENDYDDPYYILYDSLDHSYLYFKNRNELNVFRNPATKQKFKFKFAIELKHILLKLNIPQHMLAEFCETSQSTISKLLDCNNTMMPSGYFIFKLTQIQDITEDDIHRLLCI